MIDNQNQIGVLYKIDPNIPLALAVSRAKQNFDNAPHAGKRGHLPTEAQFHPDELPNELEICGLFVIENDEVRPGHVRIATCSISDEFKREMARFKRAVQVVMQDG